MRPPIKLSAIDQEHLQELYNEAAIPREELPYTAAYDQICQGFQDRTFKNAHPEQVFAALLKYVRSGSHPSQPVVELGLTDEQLKQLKDLLPRHAKGGKVLPYGDEFEAVQKEFSKLSKTSLEAGLFWKAIIRSQGPKRRPPKRVKVTAPPAEEEDDIE
jgi:hypothetical protein